MNRKGFSVIVATLVIVVIVIGAGVSLGYFFFNQPAKAGYYGEVVGINSQGNPIIRFVYFNKIDNSSDYCLGSTRALLGAYQIRNQTFFYFYPNVGLGNNIIATNVSATQEMYQRGAICP